MPFVPHRVGSYTRRKVRRFDGGVNIIEVIALKANAAFQIFSTSDFHCTSIAYGITIDQQQLSPLSKGRRITHANRVAQKASASATLDRTTIQARYIQSCSRLLTVAFVIFFERSRYPELVDQCVPQTHGKPPTCLHCSSNSDELQPITDHGMRQQPR